MYIFRKKKDLNDYLLSLREKGWSVGYVPTMGALHDGHLALVGVAKMQNDVTVCSIFVNPTQFNDAHDFEKYPLQPDIDIQLLTEAGASVLYMPETKEVYPEGLSHLEKYDFGELEKIAEGAHRQGHFQGVGQVLSRFVTLISPDRMYMGQKDYQQVLITKRLMQLLELKVEIVSVPIRRASDGLALSSRNMRLSTAARKIAPSLYKALGGIAAQKDRASSDELIEQAKQYLSDKGFKVEYLMLADAETLQPEDHFRSAPQVLLVAAWLDGVRLIDNILLSNGNLI